MLEPCQVEHGSSASALDFSGEGEVEGAAEGVPVREQRERRGAARDERAREP